jgi:hypothetical protein
METVTRLILACPLVFAYQTCDAALPYAEDNWRDSQEDTSTQLCLLQTASLVHSSHSVPSRFFDDAVPVVSHHSESRHEAVESPSMALYDVGSNSVPMPQWAIDDSKSVAHGPFSLAQSSETRRRRSAPLSLTQSAGRLSRSSQQLTVKDVAAVKSHPQLKIKSPSLNSDAEGQDMAVVSDTMKEDHIPLFPQLNESLAAAEAMQVVATEPPLAAESVASAPSQTKYTEATSESRPAPARVDMNTPEAASLFVDCEADAAAEDCVRVRTQALKQAEKAERARLTALAQLREHAHARAKMLQELHALQAKRDELLNEGVDNGWLKPDTTSGNSMQFLQMPAEKAEKTQIVLPQQISTRNQIPPSELHSPTAETAAELSPAKAGLDLASFDEKLNLFTKRLKDDEQRIRRFT